MTREPVAEMAWVRVLMSPELMAEFASRAADGSRVTWDWGEPDADGFHTPTVHVDHEDRLGTLDAAWAAVEAALPEGWMGPNVQRLQTSAARVYPWWAGAWEYARPNRPSIFAEGPTPAAALLALAEKLRAEP